MKDEFGIDTTLPHYEVRRFLAKNDKGGRHFDYMFKQMVDFPEGVWSDPSQKLETIIGALNAKGYWWHLSHLEATVIITDNTVPWQNAIRHDEDGRPYRYSRMHNKNDMAYALCVAWIKAVYDLPTAYYTISTIAEEKKANSWMKKVKR